MSLKQQTVGGVFWTFLQQFSVQLINFVVQIILARILLPAEFGLIAMLTVFIAIGNQLMDSGMTSSLIRTPKPDHEDYSTVFFVNLGVSIIFYIILFFTAPLISDFYSQPILTAIIRVYSLSFIISAFMAVQTTRLTKNLRFKVQMAMQVPSVVVGGVTGVMLAKSGYGVWSLVWMHLSQAFLFTMLHWIFSGWRPTFVINKDKLKYHFGFGYKLTLSGLLNAVFDNAYNIVIGKFFSATLLGYYNRAYTLQLFPVKNISTALNKVTYPIFASIQDDDLRLRNAYRKLLQQVMFWVTPLLTLSAALADQLFLVLLTEKWLPAVPYFQVLCVVGILYPLQQYNLNILRVKGRSDLVLKINIVKKVTLIVGISAAISFGIMALLITQALFSILSYVYNSYYSGRFIRYNVWAQIKDILPTIGLGIICSAGVFMANRHINEFDHELLRLSICYLLGFALYLTIAFLFKYDAIIEFLVTIKRRKIT